jgi:hypothetical protein
MTNWVKQTQQLTSGGNKVNGGNGDQVIGGLLTGVPAGIPGASQGGQTLPGDRFVLGALDAYALSNTSVGTLYCGIYMYVAFNATAGNAALGQLVFWDPSVFSIATSKPNQADGLYQVTTAEAGTGAGRVPPIAGVALNAVTQGFYWFVQIAGKATTLYGAATGSFFGGTSTYVNYGGVFAGGYGKTAGSGLVTSINGAIAAPTSTNIADFLDAYIGVAEGLPAASGLYITDLKLQIYRL